MLRALRHRDYRRLYVAQIIALLGTGIASVALGLLAYQLAGAQAGEVLGTALTVKMLAYVFVAPMASALVAGLPRKAVLVGADLTRLAAALLLLVPAQTLFLTVAAAMSFVLVQTVVAARSAFGLGESGVAWLLAVNGLGSMAAALALPRLLRRIPERPVMLAGGALLVAGTACIPLALRSGSTAALAGVVGLWLVTAGSLWKVSEPTGSMGT